MVVGLHHVVKLEHAVPWGAGLRHVELWREIEARMGEAPRFEVPECEWQRTGTFVAADVVVDGGAGFAMAEHAELPPVDDMDSRDAVEVYS